MDDNIDNLVIDIQNQVFDKARSDFGSVVFERLRKPLYMCALDNPHGYGCVTGSCGDTMQREQG